MALTTVRSTGIGSLPAISGANLTSLNASNISSGTLNSARFSGGKIGQVLTANREGSVTASPSSFTSITGDLELAITPSATSSKILIVTHLNGVQAVDWFYGSIGRSISGGASTSNLCSGQYGFGVAYSINNTMVTMSFLDSPNTTSAVTYYPTFRDDNGANNVKINMENTQCSSITLSEVLA